MTRVESRGLPAFTAWDAPEAVAEAIDEHGGVIVEGLADESTIEAICGELLPYLDQVPFSEGYFMGKHTKRTSRLIRKSPTPRRLITHPLVLEVVGRLVAGHCHNFQLHSTVAIRDSSR